MKHNLQHRMDNRLPTFFTSNLSLEELERRKTEKSDYLHVLYLYIESFHSHNL